MYDETKEEPVKRSISMTNDRPLMAWLLFIHAAALGIFFTFSWKALLLFVVLSWLTGGIGICMGYHRFLTHHSFQAPRFFGYFLAIAGCLAGQGGPISWVAAHRYHHANSDHDKDPHSPTHGFLWAHMGWMFERDEHLLGFERYKNYAADLARDRFLVLLDRFHMVPTILLGAALFAWGGWSFLFWGLFARLVVVYHVTWLVNSAAHRWGYRTYETPDRSKNNWWVGLLTMGEGWHNNHHANQRSARHGLQWWELDMTYMTIVALSSVGLTSQVQVAAPRVITIVK